MTENCVVILIGSGPGGRTHAHSLLGPGKTILLLEHGDLLPRELDNRDARSVFVEGKYMSKNTWFERDGRQFRPQVPDQPGLDGPRRRHLRRPAHSGSHPLRSTGRPIG
jgi:choline dehydrogenase-like flavoprotein